MLKLNFHITIALLLYSALLFSSTNYTQTKSFFVQNKGQVVDQHFKANNDVRYLLNVNSALNISLRKKGFSYDIFTKQEDSTFIERIDVFFKNANPNYSVKSKEKANAYLNYYSPSISEGATFIPQFNRVVYQNIYPNIDVEFIANNGDFKYNFIVHPGGNANDIQLEYRSRAEVHLNDSGNIKITGQHKTLSEHIPKSYLLKSDSSVAVSYSPDLKNSEYSVFSFEVPKYNKQKTLIIDPLIYLEWGSYYGGLGGAEIYALEVSQNETFVIGRTQSQVNIATSNTFISSYPNTFHNNAPSFIASLDHSGQRKWGTYLISTDTTDQVVSLYENVAINAFEVDNNQNIYIGGSTPDFGPAPSFIATPGTHQTQMNPSGGYDSFLMKFNPDGTRSWGTYYGGVPWNGFLVQDHEQISSIAIDNEENAIYVGGATYSWDSIATPGSFQDSLHVSNNSSIIRDAFIAKFDSTGNRIWGTYFGGSDGDEEICEIEYDQNGHLFISGGTSSSQDLTTPGAHRENFFTPNPSQNQFWGFYAMFDKVGNRKWATYANTPVPSNSTITSICTFNNPLNHSLPLLGQINAVSNKTQNGAVFASQTWSDTGVSSQGAFQDTLSGFEDVALVKFDTNGQKEWGTYLGGSDSEIPHGLEYDTAGNIYVSGETSSTDFPTTSDAYLTSGRAFLTKISPSGNLLWSSYLMDRNYTNSTGFLPYGLGISDSNKIYIAGTSTLDSLATPGTFMPTRYPGSTYLIFGFIRKYSPACPIVAITGDTLYCIGDTLKLNAQSDDSPYGWQWTGPNGFAQSGDEAVINDISQQDSGLYVFSDSIKCNIDSFRVLVFEPQKLSLDSSYSLCVGDTVSIPHQMQQINWQPQYNAQNKSDSLLLLYPSQDTSYSIAYIDTNGCSGKDSSYILANNLTATANWQDTIYCGADSIPLDIAVNSSRPFDFSYVDAVSLADTSELNTFFEVEGNDVNETFSFVVNDSVGCRDSLAFSVVAGSQPKASLDYSLDIDCNGAQTRLTASSTNADSTYWIIDGQRTREGETSFTLPYRGNTTFSYWAVNSETCKDSASITTGDTSLSELIALDFPSVITPNGDGINDYFELKGNSDLAYCAEVQIFNRWGNLIFEGTANEIRWDGNSFSGEEVPPGTYYFTATVGNQQKRGSITVLK